MKRHLLSLWLLAASSTHALAPVPTDAQAPQAHAAGSCGSLGPGTGLRDGKGWAVSMLPGRHEFRMRGGGTVYVTVARKTVLGFDAGRPHSSGRCLAATGVRSRSTSSTRRRA